MRPVPAPRRSDPAAGPDATAARPALSGTIRAGTRECPVSEELLINVTPRETRVALVENGLLQDWFVYHER